MPTKPLEITLSRFDWGRLEKRAKLLMKSMDEVATQLVLNYLREEEEGREVEL